MDKINQTVEQDYSAKTLNFVKELRLDELVNYAGHKQAFGYLMTRWFVEDCKRNEVYKISLN